MLVMRKPAHEVKKLRGGREYMKYVVYFMKIRNLADFGESPLSFQAAYAKGK
jgi:hypothetical protein